ncbi:MAG: cohesin domain-containing protein [Candidatus Hydrogenedentota bacterium]
MQRTSQATEVRHLRGGWLIGLALVLLPVTALAGTLSIGRPTVEDSNYVFPITLRETTDEVAALNFQLEYDPEVFAPAEVAAGAAAMASRKQVEGNTPVPGRYTVLMSGLNQETVSSGAVAYVTMRTIAEPAEQLTRLLLVEPTLATYDGVELPARGSARLVRFDDGAEEEPAEPEREESGPENGDASETREDEAAEQSVTAAGDGLFPAAPRNDAKEEAGAQRAAPSAHVPGETDASAPETGQRQRIPGADGHAGDARAQDTHAEASHAEQRTGGRRNETATAPQNAVPDGGQALDDGEGTEAAETDFMPAVRSRRVVAGVVVAVAVAVAVAVFLRTRKT